MTWAKIDDLMPEHPKVLRLSSDAFRVHVSAICYASRNLTDGAIADAALHSLRATDAVVHELKRANLWERERGKGWQIHDYLEYNPSREQVLAQRQERARAGQRGGQAAARARAIATDTAGATPLASSPVPSRPVGRSTIRSVGKEEDQLNTDRSVGAKPTIREPAAPSPAAPTDVLRESPPPTDRSPPPAGQDGTKRDHEPDCTCESCFTAKRGGWAHMAGTPTPISEDTRQKIADLLGYPLHGKKINAMLTGQVEWCAGATEANWLVLIRKATHGKNKPEVQDDGSIREGWARATMRSIREGAGR